MQRLLGRSGIEVSAVGMGCWAIGGLAWRGEKPIGWGDVDDAESIRAVHRAIDLGATFFDTSDVYGAGHSETVLGQALQGKRDQVVIATKFGNQFDETTRQVAGSSSEPDYVRRACEASLKRLQTDVIDLYQLHIGISLDEVDNMLEVLEELVAAGKIRAYAWSTDNVDNVKAFARGEHCTAVQNRLNVMEDAPELLQTCDELNLASVNRSPLAMGLLTGKFSRDSELPKNDVRGDEPGWMKYFKDGKPVPEWLDKLDSIREILTSNERTLAQGALAWIWARSDKTIPIPGFKSVAQVEDNVGAMEKGALTPAQMQEIDSILGRGSS